MPNESHELKKDDRVVLLDPGVLHPPMVSSRHESAFCGSDFAELKNSIQAEGRNLQPILVRPKGGSETYEIIFGERRVRACLQSGIKVRAIIDESADDIQAFFQTVRENQGRRELCAYELGRLVLVGIDRHFFDSQEDASKKLGRHKSVVSRAVAIASLPAEFVSAYRTPGQIQYAHVEPLAAALKKAPEVVIAEALKIRLTETALGGAEVLQRLVNAATGNVAPCNIATKVTLEFMDQTFGTLQFGAKAGIQLKFDRELNASQQQSLEIVLQRFCRQKLKKPKEGAKKEMTPRQFDREVAKFKAKIADLKRKGIVI